MPIRVGTAPVIAAYSGSTPVQRIYLNGTVVYARWTDLGMTKSGNQAGTGTAPSALTGWTADPGTVVASNGIVIPAGVVNQTVTAKIRIAWTGGSSPRVQAVLRHNGASVAQTALNNTNPQVLTTTRIVNAGDTLGVWWAGEGSVFNRPSAQGGAGTYLRITTN